MAGVALEITIDDTPVRAALGRLAALDGEALHPALDVIGDAMVASTVDRFDRGIGPSGVPWKPSKRAIRTGTKTLIESTRLVGSIVHNVFSDTVEWGTNVIYAAVHQFGATFTVFARGQDIFRKTDKAKTQILPGFVKKSQSNFASHVVIPEHLVTIEARPFLGVDNEDLAEMGNTLRNQLVRALTGSAADFMGPA